MSSWLQMGGYGAFVWSAYGISITVLLGNIIWTKTQRKKMLKQLKTFLLRSDS